MDFFDLVENVRSMRRLKPDPIPLHVLRRILNVGTFAPSGMNTQPWMFVVVQDQSGRKFLADKYREAMEERFGDRFRAFADDNSPRARSLRAVRYQIDHFDETPAVLLVCGQRDWPFSVSEDRRIGKAPPNFGAVYPCVQNILLACRASGLGATLTTMHQTFEPALHERFRIPEDYGVVVMVPIGYPIGQFGPVSRRPSEEVTFFDVWGSQRPDLFCGVRDA